MYKKLTTISFVVIVGTLFALPETSSATLRARQCQAAPSVERMICVVDPCTGCAKEVCVCVPCCCTEDPCVTCRRGVFGRTVLQYCWPCCGYKVEVVINRLGAIRVR